MYNFRAQWDDEMDRPGGSYGYVSQSNGVDPTSNAMTTFRQRQNEILDEADYEVNSSYFVPHECMKNFLVHNMKE